MAMSLLILLSMAWLCLATPVKASEVLSELSPAQQTAITLSCTPRQFTQGSDAYRECLRSELAAAQVLVEPADAAILSNLSIDEHYAIQRACIDKASVSAEEYAACARTQLDELNQEPTPQLAVISADEQYVISQQCFDTQTSAGAGAYRECINSALATLEALPGADFTSLSAVERNETKLACSNTSNNVSAYRKCLLGSPGIDFEPDTSTVAQLDPADAPQVESDVPLAALEQNTQTPLQETAPDTSTSENDIDAQITQSQTAATLPSDTATAFAPSTLIPSVVDEAKAVFANFSPAHWAALLLALCLPFAYGMFRSRRRNAGVTATPIRVENPVRQSRIHDHDLPAEPYAPVKPERSATVKNARPVPDSESLSLDQTLMPDTLDLEDDQPTLLARTQIKPGRRPAARQLRFIDWLSDFSKKEQQEYAIEFLIYWMAYADHRYDPALKQQVFEMTNPDIRTLIKRWVFKKDAIAFTDTIGFLQVHTSTEKRRQILDLLMALLVTEKALTPVQNNLLRFLADAFGIYTSGLNEQFDRAYGHSMPAIPRPDKILWWNQLSAEQKLRWDARAVARQPEQIRYRIALGQPLQGPLDQKSVDRSYKLAMRRCHRDRVNLLGERETILLDTQRKKFETAHRALLEPIT